MRGIRLRRAPPAAISIAPSPISGEGARFDGQRLRRLSPLGWDHINLTGDYVWSEAATYDADGLRLLNSAPEPIAA